MSNECRYGPSGTLGNTGKFGPSGDPGKSGPRGNSGAYGTPGIFLCLPTYSEWQNFFTVSEVVFMTN